MTRKELAEEFVAARIELAKAHQALKEAEKDRRLREAAKARIEKNLGARIADYAARGTEPAKDCAVEAVTFADAIAWWRKAETVATDAKDHLEACTKEADRALEALVASGSP